MIKTKTLIRKRIVFFLFFYRSIHISITNKSNQFNMVVTKFILHLSVLTIKKSRFILIIYTTWSLKICPKTNQYV